MNEKKVVGEKAIEYVKDGMVVGLGTGQLRSTTKLRQHQGNTFLTDNGNYIVDTSFQYRCGGQRLIY